MTLVALSGMTDIRQLCSGSPELVKQKVGRVVLMSGVEVEGNETKLSEEGSAASISRPLFRWSKRLRFVQGCLEKTRP